MTGWMDSILKEKQNLLSKQHFYYFVFSLLSLVLVLNFFSPGYALTLDMIFTPDTFRISDSFYGLSNQYSTLPFFTFLDFLSVFLSNQFIQNCFFSWFFLCRVSPCTNSVLKNGGSEDILLAFCICLILLSMSGSWQGTG